MQEKSQDKRRVSAKPPAAGGGARSSRMTGHRSINCKDTSSGKGTTSLFSATGSNKGLAIVLYGIQDSYGLPSEKLRMQQMMKELLIRRALAPPPRRLTLRWRNFHPAPSRLSLMSMT